MYKTTPLINKLDNFINKLGILRLTIKINVVKCIPIVKYTF